MAEREEKSDESPTKQIDLVKICMLIIVKKEIKLPLKDQPVTWVGDIQCSKCQDFIFLV